MPFFLAISSIFPSFAVSLSSPVSSSPVEEHSVMYLMVPKPLDSFNLLRVKGKGLKQKVLHASCEWYVSFVALRMCPPPDGHCPFR